MGTLDFGTITLAAIAFFAVGMVWYGLLFGKVWQRAAGLTDEEIRKGLPMWAVFGLCFAFELLIALTLAHQFAMTGPSDRAIMMIAIGFGSMIMTPAIGIVYLFQRKSGLLFAIDAGHFIAGMAAMGAVFAAFN